MEHIRSNLRRIKMISDTACYMVKGMKATIVAITLFAVFFLGSLITGSAKNKALTSNASANVKDLSYIGRSIVNVDYIDVNDESVVLGSVNEIANNNAAMEIFFAGAATIDVAAVSDKVPEAVISPVVTYTVASAVYNSNTVSYTEEDLLNLQRIVQAEAGCCDMIGRILVANVIINRVNSNRFPNTITEVIFAPNQFSPISDGAFYRVTVTEETKQAVERALSGEDYSQGATFFAATRIADTCWAGRTMKHLFEHDGHTFFAPY